MKNKAILFITFLSLIATVGFAQEKQPAGGKKADKQYDKYAYIDATKTYERVAAKGYKSAEMFMKLGNAYYFNAELDKANKWYDELFAMGTDVDPEYYYRYAQTLKSVKNYTKADQMMAKFAEKSGDDVRAKLYKSKQDYMDEIKANSGRYKIEDAGINSKYSDYGTAFFGNQVVFASSRDTGNFAQKKHKWSNQYFLNLYSSENTPRRRIGSSGKILKEHQFKIPRGYANLHQRW